MATTSSCDKNSLVIGWHLGRPLLDALQRVRSKGDAQGPRTRWRQKMLKKRFTVTSQPYVNEGIKFTYCTQIEMQNESPSYVPHLGPGMKATKRSHNNLRRMVMGVLIKLGRRQWELVEGESVRLHWVARIVKRMHQKSQFSDPWHSPIHPSICDHM